MSLPQKDSDWSRLIGFRGQEEKDEAAPEATKPPVAEFGVGILLDKLTMKVTGCIPGLAADRSGMILPGDEIVKINGKEMFYWDDPLEGFENLGFLGKEGTLVRVDVKRLENPGTPIQRYRWFAIELMRGTCEYLDLYNKCRTLEFRNSQLERPEKEVNVNVDHVDRSDSLELREEIERLTRQLELMQKKSTEDDAEIEDLKRQNKKLSSETERAYGEMKSLKDMIEKLRALLLENDKAAEIERLKLELKKTQQELETTRYNFEQAHKARIQLEAKLT
ncbi:hypothetical protein GUITHDRAFT_99035 [Guillardia theta CCMP2712]|uniref:PDZ domain-containing protein n=1 Tax=Guillardia theta (strain CCMP2712) TaxID=905079 RepID=L1K3V2_GUITC|nr:hypothetical protein GUITHDRAFT_99035 [Guillardia theta CCMP2712]EKX55252.1 hypothetical protein GUITHDRAFT_99035 [Guillardia theta CCMP2712]|eukprot:XP_005842232.1 hypothetical protein GUITHDRAFT_99035 [Guillardia theta CCMP2712]